jgi:hypothetical protein
MFLEPLFYGSLAFVRLGMLSVAVCSSLACPNKSLYALVMEFFDKFNIFILI